MSYVPALPAALGVAAGIVLYAAMPSWIVACGAVLTALAAFVMRRHWAGYTLFFVAVGWGLALLHAPAQLPAQCDGLKTTWGGEVEDVKASRNAVTVTVMVDSCGGGLLHPFRCVLSLPVPTERYCPGDRVVFAGRMSGAVRCDVPDERTTALKDYVDGVVARCNVAPDDIYVTSSRMTLRRCALKCRAALRDIIYKLPVSDDLAWFLSATLLGDDSSLDTGVRDVFRRLGTAHYLAISGFHVGIMALIASIAFFPLRLWRRYGRLRYLGVIALIWFYAFVCGLAPSIVRASVIVTVFLSARVLQRQSSPYNSLCVAALLILAVSPRAINSPSFQLSFAAVLAIIAIAPRINPFKSTSSWSYRLASLVTVPLSAMVGTCLIAIVHFHNLPLLFLLPNIVLAVMLPILLAGGVVMCLCVVASIGCTALGGILDFIYAMVMRLCGGLSSMPFAELSGIYLTPFAVLLLTASVVAAALALNMRRRFLWVLSLAFAVGGAAVYVARMRLPEAEMYVTRQAGRTDVVVRDGMRCRLITSAPAHLHDDISQRLSRRYADFLSRRDCGEDISVSNDDFVWRSCSLHYPWLVFGDKVFCLAFDEDMPCDTTLHVDYMIVARAGGAKAFEKLMRCHPDTVLLSSDLPLRRASAIADSCRNHSMPAIRLSERPFCAEIKTF